ncbi:ankyrin repeat domain-containing protein SOWAHB-like [Chaetodon trifascialis]|uniref:ankyrin repeat domain-containing protein SOWAHB-like n=1 Tax=Chaetodon trifascialis TaxID=109706 RepID=UPI0039911780
MATDLSQDTVLHFIQSSGGSVKNADLLLHFRNFIRDHADRERNREHFKKFVNSVATVQQVDGVSYVVLRRKFRRHDPGGGEGGSSGPLRPRKNPEPSAENAKLSPAEPAEKRRYKPPLREVAAPAPPGGTTGKTFLPAAGIVLNNNNNNVETNLNLKQKRQQVTSSPEVSDRPSAAQVISQISEKTEMKAPSLSQPPAQHHRVGFELPPGIPPVVAAVRHHGQTSQPVPEPLRERQACVQPGGALHQEPPLHHVQSQLAPRRIRHRQSYKSAVSCDEDEEEEEEEEEMVPTRPVSAGGTRPMNASLGDMERTVSASSPCITDPPVPSVASSSSSSGRKPPKIFIETVKEQTLPPGDPGRTWESEVRQRGQWTKPGLDPGSVPGGLMSSRRSLPLEAERFTPSPDRATEVAPHRDVHMDCRYSQAAGVQQEPGQGLDQSQRLRLSSSHSSIFSPSSDAGPSSSDWQPSGSPRAWADGFEDLQARTGNARGGSSIEVLQQARGTKFESTTHHASSKITAPWHHSTGHLLEDQEPAALVLQWNRSTGDLYDDREQAESSEGSISTPPLRQRPAVTRQFSSQMRNRMCRSLGANLDQLLQEEGKGGGSEAARLNRLHLISSSLSLRYNLSSSSLSSCSTPPRCNSLADLDEGMEGKGGRRSLPAASSSTAHHEGSSRQSVVPLEPKEHTWLVKGAAGAWPDIYSLFREDSSLLNRRDFISGFTVLHWIAKHGDHRVLNTLWYGVQKAGLTFDINARSACGYTPLHIAAIHGHKNIMRLLVKNFNADVRLRDTAGKKPWQYLSSTMSPEVFQLLGAPPRAAGKREGGVGRLDLGSKSEPRRRHRRRHHLSSASSGERPLTISGTTKVKRSSSIAAFLKHKSLHRFHGHHSDSSI